MASNLYKVLLWEDAVERFNNEVLPQVIATEKLYGSKRPDLPMRREAWNNWTDMLCKNREISDWQYANWPQPDSCDG